MRPIHAMGHQSVRVRARDILARLLSRPAFSRNYCASTVLTDANSAANGWHGLKPDATRQSNRTARHHGARNEAHNCGSELSGCGSCCENGRR